MKFRKKPIVIEAIQWNGSVESIDKINSRFGADVKYYADTGGVYVSCITLEGPLTVSPNDWIIKGIKGEIYPCKPDIFAATYEPVEEENQNG